MIAIAPPAELALLAVLLLFTLGLLAVSVYVLYRFGLWFVSTWYGGQVGVATPQEIETPDAD